MTALPPSLENRVRERPGTGGDGGFAQGRWLNARDSTKTNAATKLVAALNESVAEWTGQPCATPKILTNQQPRQ
jgi:hypothetical protein